MLRKLIIINILIVIALLPVAQAVGPVAGPMESGQHHEMVQEECTEPGYEECVDSETCILSTHTHCDSKSKFTLKLPGSFDEPGNSKAAYSPNRYLSPQAEVLLRPPRNA